MATSKVKKSKNHPQKGFVLRDHRYQSRRPQESSRSCPQLPTTGQEKRWLQKGLPAQDPPPPACPAAAPRRSAGRCRRAQRGLNALPRAGRPAAPPKAPAAGRRRRRRRARPRCPDGQAAAGLACSRAAAPPPGRRGSSQAARRVDKGRAPGRLTAEQGRSGPALPRGRSPLLGLVAPGERGPHPPGRAGPGQPPLTAPQPVPPRQHRPLVYTLPAGATGNAHAPGGPAARRRSSRGRPPAGPGCACAGRDAGMAARRHVMEAPEMVAAAAGG